MQTSFLVAFLSPQVFPNFILLFAVFFILFEDPKENFSFLAAATSGFYIDIFSSRPLGATIIFFLLLTCLLKLLITSLNRLTLLWLLALSLLALILNNLFSGSFSYLANGHFPFSFCVMFPVSMAYSLIFFIIIFYIFRLSRKNA